MLVFQNKGLIPVEGIFTMGLNVKDGKNPIGHFGTGLKLSIAVILRDGGSITIWRGRQPTYFKTVRREVRDKEFDFIVAVDEAGRETPTHMTTELGKNWHAWMVMRELESNVRDEQGRSFLHQRPEELLEEDVTTVVVDCPGVQEAWMRRSEYFLDYSEPVWSHNGIFELHSGACQDYYYRGIKVGSFAKEFPYTLNIVADFSGELAEDRSLNPFYAHGILERYLTRLTDTEIMRRIFPTVWMEEGLVHNLDFSRASVPTPEFADFINELSRKSYLAVPKTLMNRFIFLGHIDKHSTMRVQAPTEVQQKMLARAQRYIRDLGYEEETIKLYPVYVADLGPTLYGLADIPGERIYLSPSSCCTHASFSAFLAK